MDMPEQTIERIRQAVRPQRLLETALRLIEVPSPTRSAGAAADRLAELLRQDGFDVERPAADWPQSPAVVVRWCPPGTRQRGGGHTLQFDGHLDTVHLPFVPARFENGIVYGSGASDMKGGVAAMVEALRVLRDTDALPRGQILLTAHDLHESPWGDGAQLEGLIREGCVGDAVLLPEYLFDRIAIVGRGLAVLEVRITRDGEPVHECAGGMEQPSVIAAGAELIRALGDLDRQLAKLTHPLAGRESLFIGQVHSGEIFNQSPVEFTLAGTRRWLPGTRAQDVEKQYRAILGDIARRSGTNVEGRFILTRDAFSMDPQHPIVAAFHSACQAVMGRTLPLGAKPFVDDGNAFSAHGVPCITHGPAGKGPHTLHESCPLDEMARVAVLYALTAVAFCSNSDE